MRIAIVHYHLRPGGVGRVIQHTCAALPSAATEVLVLSGELPPPDLRLPARVQWLEALAYSDSSPGASPSGLRRQLESAATAAWGGRPDLWHFHNHALGKNLALAAAVRELAGQGDRLLLQIHDFAEDGRPENYQAMLRQLGRGSPARLNAVLYPQSPSVHYAVLNTRDRGFLSRAGVPDDRLHVLPDPIAVRPASPGPAGAGSRPTKGGALYLYPTRAIRRKNLGEFMLWSALGSAGDRFATTLAPHSPADRLSYDRWAKFARAAELPVEFELGARVPFEDLLTQAHALVTTSVAEGFGLAYLEPWLAGKPLAGRDLPEITAEFKEAGIQLPGLYERLEIPVDWIGRAALQSCLAERRREYLAEYGRSQAADDGERVMASAVQNNRVDFGRLDEAMQERVIERVRRQPSARDEMSPATLYSGVPAANVEANARAIHQKFGLEKFGRRLTSLYQAVAGSAGGAVTALAGDAILDAFLAPERFCLLRT